ncbi:MAG: hypothetical protein H6Q99_1824 [Proteobacteria bacterium]|nr:hypothetical protein [Pseudomonadota bacterium]
MQLDADEVIRVLNLNERLGKVGQPIRVGSSAMGLMVRRDIDITVVCAALDKNTLADFAEIGASLMQRTDYVTAVRFRNDTGQWNAEPRRTISGPVGDNAG